MISDQCPNTRCRSQLDQSFAYRKRGYFITKWNAQPVPRYQCKICSKYFSSHTFKNWYRHKKPYLNLEIFRLYSSGVTLRRLAKVCGVNRKTVHRKFLYLAALSRQAHELELQSGRLETRAVQFDEMESFEHTRLKPLTVALAVCARSARIIDVNVAQMGYKGRLAHFAFQKYGPREDRRHEAQTHVIQAVSKCALDDAVVTCDSKPEYLPLIQRLIPRCEVKQVSPREEGANLFKNGRRRNVHDALFRLNHTAAKIRHDLSRMQRKVWVTTKLPKRLQAHLDLYIAYINGYALAA